MRAAASRSGRRAGCGRPRTAHRGRPGGCVLRSASMWCRMLGASIVAGGVGRNVGGYSGHLAPWRPRGRRVCHGLWPLPLYRAVRRRSGVRERQERRATATVPRLAGRRAPLGGVLPGVRAAADCAPREARAAASYVMHRCGVERWARDRHAGGGPKKRRKPHFPAPRPRRERRATTADPFPLPRRPQAQRRTRATGAARHSAAPQRRADATAPPLHRATGPRQAAACSAQSR